MAKNTTYEGFYVDDDLYSIGDDVLVKAPGSLPPYIGHIHSIHVDKDDQAFTKVTWYYRPEETSHGRKGWQGSREVFASDHMDKCYVNCIDGKAVIMDIDEYSALEHIADNHFFSRLSYSVKSNKLKPSPESLPKVCVCKRPYNPDHMMVGCDSCGNWFHLNCIKMSQKALDNLAYYVCKSCSK